MHPASRRGTRAVVLNPKDKSLKPKKRPRSVEAQLRAYSNIPLHPLQDDFIAAALRLLAHDVITAACVDAPVTEDEAMAGAKAEFDTGLVALVFVPEDRCFHAVWRSRAWGRLLKPYLYSAWLSAPGKYGERAPKSYDPKRNPITRK